MTIRIGNQTAYMARPLTLPFEYAVSKKFDAFEWFPDKKPWGEGFLPADIDAPARAVNPSEPERFSLWATMFLQSASTTPEPTKNPCALNCAYLIRFLFFLK